MNWTRVAQSKLLVKRSQNYEKVAVHEYIHLYKKALLGNFCKQKFHEKQQNRHRRHVRIDVRSILYADYTRSKIMFMGAQHIGQKNV